MDLKSKAKELKKQVPAVFLALKRKDTPVPAKMLAAVTVAYALSPIDLVPDFIPVLGYLDDLLILPLLVAAIVKLIPEAVWTDSLADAEGLWKDGRPKKWYYALPVILIWLLILKLIIKAVVTRVG